MIRHATFVFSFAIAARSVVAFVPGFGLSKSLTNSAMAPKTITTTSATSAPVDGAIVTIDAVLEAEGDFVPETLFDSNCELKFVLNGGNYLPGLHQIVSDMKLGETVETSIDAGWGERNPDLVATISKADMAGQIDVNLLKIGTELMLSNGLKCAVTEITDDNFTIDANPPLAGASYAAKVTLTAVEDAPINLEYLPMGSEGKYKVATFGLGCFWGGELAFMRQRGVVGTKVGYTQGEVENPDYKQVCSGNTGHTEAIMVTYDPTEVTYENLVHLAMDRLGESKYLLNQVGNDRGTQYRHGVYYHDDEQKTVAEKIVGDFGDDCVTEVKPASKFWDAEEYHQQYLLKGGQSARKGDESSIRCYG